MSEYRMPIFALDTPSVVVYLDVLEANIAEMSRLAAEAGVKLRPHTKIHECPDIAKLQIAGGACGIEVGTIERAICMAEAGIEDILVAHPFFGDQRLDMLRRLLEKPRHCVMVDMWHVKARVSSREACGAAVLCSVMSAVDPQYVVIDAGYKTFGADSLIQYRDLPGFFWQEKPSYGSVQGRPDLWMGRLSAETAGVQYMEPNIASEERLRVGDRLEIVPNNATLVISMQERIYGVRHGLVERVFAVAGRGQGTPAA